MTEQIGCLIKYSRKARNLRLTVYPDKRVILTMPLGYPVEKARVFLISKTKWISKKLLALKEAKPLLDVSNSKGEYKKFKIRAIEIIRQRLEYFKQYYPFNFKNLSVKNQKSVWGSCSKSGNLNFNYRIIFLPKEQMDYIIVHELCHLKELNHSARFWAEVAKCVPDYKHLRKQLKKLIL